MTADAAAPPAALETHRHNPYVGPRSLCADDRIYGRSREIRELRASLVAHRVVLLYAVSGAGKTSLIEAGLRPQLEEREFQVLPPIRVGYEPPAAEGLTGVNRYVLSVMTSLEEARPPDEQMDPAELADMGLDEYIRRCDDQVPDKDPCLIFDQFEEVFTLDPTDWDAKEEFFVELGRVLSDRGRWALFAMREDFIAQLDPYLALIPTHFDTRYRIDLLGPDAAMQAITKPAKAGDVEFSSEAAGKIVDDLRRIQVQRGDESVKVQGPSVEPVQLQVVCRRLWANLDSGTAHITLDDVAAAGTVDEALADFYDTAVKEAASPTGTRERQIRDWFDQKLITPDGFRTQVRKGPGRAGPEVLRSLQASHLLRSDRIRGAQWYELSHDRFVEPIRVSNAASRRRRITRRQNMGAAVVGVLLAFVAIWAVAFFSADAEQDSPLGVNVLEVSPDGDPIRGVIDRPGEQVFYEFGMEDGDTVLSELWTSGEATEFVPALALFDPSGEWVASGAGFPGDRDEPLLLAYPVSQDGAHQIGVAGIQDSIGPYAVVISDVDAEPLEIDGGPTAGSVDEPRAGQIGVFALDTFETDTMLSVASDESLETSVFVFGPDGRLVAGEVAGAGRAVVFPLEQRDDGAHLVVVNGRGDTVGRYDVVAESTVITGVAIGETVEGVVDESGEIVVYRSAVPAEGHVMLGVEPSDGFDAVVKVTGPDSAPATLNSDYGGAGDPEKVVIPTPIEGVYTVFVSGSGGSTGAFDLGFSPFEESSIVPLGFGESRAASIETTADIVVFGVDAAIGDTLGIVVTPDGELSPIVKVVDPSGVQVGGGFGAVGETVNVTAEVVSNGTHVIQVTGAGGSTGSFRLELLESLTDSFGEWEGG